MITRHGKSAVELFLVLLMLGTASIVSAAAAKNILLVIADDYGADGSSLYNSTGNGASLPPTPTIAALARRGVVFRNAWACPECSPSRAAMLTGRYPFRTGIGGAVGMGVPALSASEFTLPEAFSSNPSLGYHLAQFGKWHLGTGANSPNSPRTLGGWTNYAGSLLGQLGTDTAAYNDWTKSVNGTSTASYTNYATTDLVNDAMSWIGARGTNPWFCWVAFNAPHTPLHVPPLHLAPGYATNTGVSANRRQFEAMTEAMDTEFARLLTAVDTNNTHIIFLGDNGTLNSQLQPPYPSGRGKSTLYEGGIRVPLVIAGPGVVNLGRTNNTPVHLVDLFSTIMELAGMNTATTLTNTTNAIDSRSLLPVLQNQPEVARYNFSEFYSSMAGVSANSGRTIRNSDYKFITLTNGTRLFFHLATDPYERTNLLLNPLTLTAQSNYNALTMRLGNYQSALVPPTLTSFGSTSGQFTITVQRTANLSYALWRAGALDDLAWAPLTSAVIVTNGATSVTLTDPSATNENNFYRVMAAMP